MQVLEADCFVTVLFIDKAECNCAEITLRIQNHLHNVRTLMLFVDVYHQMA